MSGRRAGRIDGDRNGGHLPCGCRGGSGRIWPRNPASRSLPIYKRYRAVRCYGCDRNEGDIRAGRRSRILMFAPAGREAIRQWATKWCCGFPMSFTSSYHLSWIGRLARPRSCNGEVERPPAFQINLEPGANQARDSRYSLFPRHRRTSIRSEEHTSELQSPCNLVCRLLLEKKKKEKRHPHHPTTERINSCV